MGEAPELLAVALLLGPFLYTCVWGACQVQAGGPAALSEAAVIKLMGKCWVSCLAE